MHAFGVVGAATAALEGAAGPVEAMNLKEAYDQRLRAAEAGRQRFKDKMDKKKEAIPMSDYKELPGTNPPILYYDLLIPSRDDGQEGRLIVQEGQRITTNYDLKYKRLTIGTSRMGMGVTGGSPYGFDVGVKAATPGGPFIKAFNPAVVGMEVGGQRRLFVPPEYGYGDRQMQEIPPGATLTLDIEIVSIKTGPS